MQITEGDLIAQRYQVEEKLGQGGMGVVFRARDRILETTVAIKVLFPNTPDLVLKRFHTEAKALAQLNHPNILTVIDFGQTEDGQLYLVMDFINGNSLSSMIEESGPQSFFDVVPVFEGICRGLRFAHSNNVLHRDIKPSNIMIAIDRSSVDSVKLVDFGLAKQVDKDFDLTKTGSAMGSPPYMSPEAVHGRESDVRSEIYSLGCTLFEMMAGRPPFVGDSLFHTMMAHLHKLPPSLSETIGEDVDIEIENFVQKCLKKDPDERFQTMDELIEQFDELKDLLIDRNSPFNKSIAEEYSPDKLLERTTNSTDRILRFTGYIFLGTIALSLFFGLQMLVSGRKGLTPKNDDSLVQLVRAEKQLEKEKNEMDEAGQVRPSGASIIQDETSPDKVCKLSGKMSDAQFQREIVPYKNMRAFCLENLTISLASSNYIFHLPIENLALVDMAISERQLDDLSKLPNLKRIRFFSCGDLPAGSIEKFQRRKLKSLDFEPGRTYENFGRAVTKLDSLESVTIRNGRVRRKDLEALLARLQIKMLNFDSCSIESDAFTKLRSAKQCTFFSCVNTRLSDEQFEQVSKISNLIVLDLNRTNLNDTHLKMLHKCKGLRVLGAFDTQVSLTGLEYLKSVIPGLKIMIRRPAQNEPF